MFDPSLPIVPFRFFKWVAAWVLDLSLHLTFFRDQHRFKARRKLALVLLLHVEEAVRQDAIQPRGEGALALEVLKRPVHTQESLADYVGRFLGVSRKAERVLVGAGFVLRHQRVE